MAGTAAGADAAGLSSGRSQISAGGRTSKRDPHPEDRHAVEAKLGTFKTLMLQDVEAGRPVELDAIVGTMREIGRRLVLVAVEKRGSLAVTTRFSAALLHDCLHRAAYWSMRGVFAAP